MLWAVAASAFFGFFRLGELLLESTASFNPARSLAWGDVAVDSHTAPSMVQFHLKVSSKRDQFSAGTHMVVGRTGDAVSSVCVGSVYQHERGCQPGAFFLDASQKVLTKQRFVERIRELLTTIGLPSGGVS